MATATKGKKVKAAKVATKVETTDETLTITKGARGVRGTLFGFPFTAVIRWMGTKDFTFAQARAALDHYGAAVADGTVKIQLGAGKRGERGDPAPVKGDDAKALLAFKN